MNAIQIHGPHDVRICRFPDPTPGPDEVLIEIAFAGVCHTDIEILRGTHGAYVSGAASYPIVPGHEWSGTVRTVGAAVTRFKPGDAVTGETGIGCLRCRLCLTGAHNCCLNVTETGIIHRDGGMRELHVQPEAFVHGLGSIPLDQGALVEPASVGVYACTRVGVNPGDRVAVCGGGSIGQLCAQAAMAFGARQVILTSRSEEKLRMAEAFGVDRAVNVARENLVSVAREVTGGELFDVTIEAAGAWAALHDALQIAAPRARVAVVGCASADPYGYSPAKLIGAELTVIGVRGSPHVWPQTIDMLARGKLSVAPMISRRFTFAQAREAFEVADRGGPEILKVLLSP